MSGLRWANRHIHPMPGQLVGHRGVVSLRPGLSYRDPETVAASRRAAALARQLQGGQDSRAVKEPSRSARTKY